MQEVTTKENAVKEVTAWLDYKKIKNNQRETNSALVDLLVEAVQYGTITIDSNTFEITQKLDNPVPGLLNDLKYQPRITVGDLHKVTSVVKSGDIDGKVCAYIAALTGKGLSHIQKLDSEDYKVGQCIALFFM